jgi:N utilization substance protein B
VGVRSIAREAALMMLYAAEVQHDKPQKVRGDFFASLAFGIDLDLDLDSRAYAEEIVTKILEAQSVVDELIKKASTNWRLERMSRVDRNVLRIATHELRSGIERAIVIDEAVELAKRFGTTDSGAFVNGVLTKVADLVGSG